MNNDIKRQISSYTEAVSLALQGIEEGFTYLYEKTYYDKYYIALKYMKNEQDAQDVLQDAYIRAWGKLGSISEPEKFPSWMSRIVANTALNALAKNNPVLFSELSTENEATEVVQYDIQDDNYYVQPELAYTVQETQTMVHELLESLSDEQRICMLMFHIEGQSIKNIAETVGCSENTVKSRLNYGRNNLREKCEQLKKQGYQLYSFAPIPLLVYLVRNEASCYGANAVAAGASAAERIRNVEGVTGKNMVEKGLGGEAVKNGGGFLATAVGKLVLGFVSLALVAGIVVGVVLHNKKTDDETSNDNKPVTEKVSTDSDSADSTEEGTIDNSSADTTEETASEQKTDIKLTDISNLYGYGYSIKMYPNQQTETSYSEEGIEINDRKYDVIDGGDGYYVTCSLEYNECASDDAALCKVGDSFCTTSNKTYTVVDQEVHGNARIRLYLEDEKGERYTIADTLQYASTFDQFTGNGYCPIVREGEDQTVTTRVDDVVVFVPYGTQMEAFLSNAAQGNYISTYIVYIICFDADGNLVFLADWSVS